ncbi:hypothetical protein B0T22DRAFT_142970 [Podospora appendiculata]|uniref:Uncharacterized protein n=1 Tax=Podospora appendiculata TaxID=314037 RepID=A0AAE1CBX4_9PEZI|nr:hypothetical protein B0T22DRAFT_142970 [Podospora appendiculata]
MISDCVNTNSISTFLFSAIPITMRGSVFISRFCDTLQSIVSPRRSMIMKRKEMVISEPFNFRRETVLLPGLSEDEISVLREKAAASQLDVKDDMDVESILAGGSDYMHPRAVPSVPRSRSVWRSSSTNWPKGVPCPVKAIVKNNNYLTPISPVSTLWSVSPLDLDLDLGSPISPLLPRGSPRSPRIGGSI